MARLKPFAVRYEREVLAASFRAALEHIDGKGVLGTVRERVPEETARLIEKPPMPFRYLSSEHIDQLYVAFGEHTDHAGLVELGRAIAKGTSVSAVGPVLRMALSLFGGTPAALFGNLDRFFSVATKGISFTWTATGERSGIIDTRFAPGPPPPESATVLEGNLLYGYELCGAPTGVIEQREDLEGGHLVRVRARW